MELPNAETKGERHVVCAACSLTYIIRPWRKHETESSKVPNIWFCPDCDKKDMLDDARHVDERACTCLWCKFELQGEQYGARCAICHLAIKPGEKSILDRSGRRHHQCHEAALRTFRVR